MCFCLHRSWFRIDLLIGQLPSKSVKVFRKIGWVCILSKSINVLWQSFWCRFTWSKNFVQEKTLTKFLMENFDCVNGPLQQYKEAKLKIRHKHQTQTQFQSWELLTLPECLSSPMVFSAVRVTQSLSFMCMFYRSLFVLLSFFFWPLCCLFFNIWILITPLVSSNSSST